MALRMALMVQVQEITRFEFVKPSLALSAEIDLPIAGELIRVHPAQASADADPPHEVAGGNDRAYHLEPVNPPPH